MGGLIAPMPFTMEGISGKNPIYHTGRCTRRGDEIAWRINRATGLGRKSFWSAERSALSHRGSRSQVGSEIRAALSALSRKK